MNVSQCLLRPKKKKKDRITLCFFQCRYINTCDTHNELRSDNPVHDGTEERRDDSDTDENDRCHKLKAKSKDMRN